MRPSTEQDYHERIVRTLVFIQQHLDESLELDQVASVAAFSSFHFHRIFRGLVGESLKEHEQYLNSPQNSRPEDLVTLIHVPVE
jgi:AraC family transcriptional regulator